MGAFTQTILAVYRHSEIADLNFALRRPSFTGPRPQESLPVCSCNEQRRLFSNGPQQGATTLPPNAKAMPRRRAAEQTVLTGTGCDRVNTIAIQCRIHVYLLSTTLATSSLPQKNCVMNDSQTSCQKILTAAVFWDCLWSGQCYVAVTAAGFALCSQCKLNLRQFSGPPLDRISQSCCSFWLLRSSICFYLTRENDNNKSVHNPWDVSPFFLSYLFLYIFFLALFFRTVTRWWKSAQTAHWSNELVLLVILIELNATHTSPCLCYQPTCRAST